ncbi:DUF296 domain-containing protein [Alsobacter sp. SYSU M60028]|uniref:DUF296 domain-containing protein n=1 Tax=Alsobacter ponti TaxID=2962936 RepID=A0ABT1LI54_9HYPH|nr:DUF296 domain-containing protein [Alsobacter ponti]MCP8941124.1 DUF296 domain-containing protein [Alsobacter ponti]
MTSTVSPSPQSPSQRTIRQPGPAAAERIVAVEARGRDIAFDLEPGRLLVEAVREGLAAHGFSAGVVELGAVALSPFAYVMPALSTTGENAAFYSEVFRPAGVTRLERGALTFGERDGGAFFHCHALWAESDGRVNGGHLMPGETVVAERARVTALGLAGAGFCAVQDPETNFKLFEPAPLGGPAPSGEGTRALALRMRPNQDLFGALEAFCAARGIRAARIRGGVGSTIGARFEDGRVVENFATEVYIVDGDIRPGADGRPIATIDVGLVDYKGGIARGRLKRGDNPVLMTFELALEVVDGEGRSG